uniref:Uncharacterized protein n=1 Tax=Romanomermis culicivorax TaxID=13658 RepID=A0A915KDR9_ROMCU
MNSRAREVTSSPNTNNPMGAVSMTSGAVSTSTLNGWLSKAHGKCGYFLAKSVDLMAGIASMMEDESENEKSLNWGPWAGKRARGATNAATTARAVTVSSSWYNATTLMSPVIFSIRWQERLGVSILQEKLPIVANPDGRNNVLQGDPTTLSKSRKAS